MSSKSEPKSPYQIISNALAIVGKLCVLGFFIWHTAAYMDKIFVPPPPGDSSDIRDIAAAVVQAVATLAVGIIVICIRVAYIRGLGQDRDDRL